MNLPPPPHPARALECPPAGSSKPIHRETLSPLDTTIYRGRERPGQHPPSMKEAADSEVGRSSAKPDPKGA